MILTSYFIDSFSKRDQSFDMEVFWMHSFSVGAISRHIAERIGYPDIEKAYLVGIVHDIGKVFLGHYCREEYGRMLASISNTSTTTYEAEYEFFRTTHSEVGLCLAQRWNFPPSYSDVISHHHTSASSTDDPLLTAVVALADFYCLSHVDACSVAQASIPTDSEENAWETLRTFSMTTLGASLEYFLSSLDNQYAEISQEVDLLFSTMRAV
jgi:putative nucleotidyltransferase with HDIG domain